MSELNNRSTIKRFRDRGECYREAEITILGHIDAAIRARGYGTMVLSGGRTPIPLFTLLAREANIDWERVHLFWGDERCVPSDHPDSNFAMAHETLISRVSIPQENIHRVITQGYTPEKAAASYENQLKKFFGSDMPSFDIILLGMGNDGHTASLFPGDVALDEKERWVVAVNGEKGMPSVPRVTLTLPVINNAEHVLFLVAGEDKRFVVDEIFDNRETSKKYPAALIQPKGELKWLACD